MGEPVPPDDPVFPDLELSFDLVLLMVSFIPSGEALIMYSPGLTPSTFCGADDLLLSVFNFGKDEEEETAEVDMILDSLKFAPLETWLLTSRLGADPAAQPAGPGPGPTMSLAS